jgi:hypothetical protein
VKAKPAKIRVEVPHNNSSPNTYYSYRYGSHSGQYLPGTALIAYLPSAAPYGSDDDGKGGKMLLKYVLNWHNDEVCLPDLNGKTDTITPKTPIEPGPHSKLPLVDPGTFGLFVKQGAYEYEEPHYDDHPAPPPPHTGYQSKPGYGVPGPKHSPGHGSKHHVPKY